MKLRLLSVGDEPQLEAFLAQHRDGSMFLRSNLRTDGVVYGGKARQADYMAAFADEALVGVAAHAWNGMLQLQAPQCAAELARACVSASGREVTGLIGPFAHVKAARTALGLDGKVARKDDDNEGLFALELSELVIPAALSHGEVTARPARAQELGGIFTPPELRGRGHAKAAIAAQLQAAHAAGAERAVLFASDPKAIRCYEGLGFRRVGDFGLVLW